MDTRIESPSPVRERILVRAATGDVTVNGVNRSLPGRERELAIAIALQTQPASALDLWQILFPDRDDEGASNFVKIYVYRLRKRVATDFIVWRDGGYALGPDVQVDAAQARVRLERLAYAPQALDPDEREATLQLARGLRADPPGALLRQSWFETASTRLRRLGHDLAMVAGRNALEHGDIREAIRVGRELTYEDPCDEEAWELFIRANLNVGEHVAATQGFRYYEAVLAKELDTEPSASVRKLVESYAG